MRYTPLPGALAALVAPLLLAAPQAEAQSKLLVSEVVVTPTAGEFVEIFNPNPFVVDLSDVYLTDATFQGGGIYYYNVVTGADAGGGGFNDFHARFPDGASIAPGEYQTVAIDGSDAFLTTYGVLPDYELVDDGDGSPVPQMREALPGSIAPDSGLTNSGEVVVLYHWDGASDLVTDLDYVIWGDTNEGVDKTGVAIDGPDPGASTSTYAPDTPLASQAFITPTHAVGDSFTRIDFTEGAETAGGGNGVNGEDETSEDLPNTFATGFAASPGAGLPADQQIVATFAENGQQRGEGDGAVDIFVNVLTTDGLPTERPITLVVEQTGGDVTDADFTDIPPAVRTLVFPAGTPSGTQQSAAFTIFDDDLVEGTENADFGLTAPDPAEAPDDLGTTSFTLVILDNDGTSEASGDLVITEIMYNPRSADGSSSNDVEWIEIANTTPFAVDLSGYTLEDVGDGTATFLGGIVRPYSFVAVISDDITIGTFRSAWGSDFDIVQLDFDQLGGLSNSPGEQNEILVLRDQLRSVIDSVNVSDDAPWPADNNQSSIYLNVPNSQIIANGAALNDDGANWALSVAGVNGAFTSTPSGPFNAEDVGSPGTNNMDTALPVELAEPLAARIEGRVVTLSWSTASETNNAYFEVLARPVAEERFVSLGRVDGAGTTSESRRYAFDAAGLAAGTYRFRLRQVDLDGASALAGEVELAIEVEGTHAVTSVWPNPSTGAARLSVSAAQAQHVTVTVYDALGRAVAVVLDAPLDAQSAREVALPLALPSGPYVVEVAGERFREVRRFTVVR